MVSGVGTATDEDENEDSSSSDSSIKRLSMSAESQQKNYGEEMNFSTLYHVENYKSTEFSRCSDKWKTEKRRAQMSFSKLHCNVNVKCHGNWSFPISSQSNSFQKTRPAAVHTRINV